MTLEQVIGTYSLESFILQKSEVEKSDWGTEVHGLLLYTATGHMSVSINKAIESSPDGEIQDIFDSILFYAGTFLVSGNEIIHKVTEASNPARVGKSLIRYAKFENGILELASTVESFGQAILRWRKIK